LVQERIIKAMLSITAVKIVLPGLE